MTEYESGKQVAFEHTILEVLEICKNSKSPEEIISKLKEKWDGDIPEFGKNEPTSYELKHCKVDVHKYRGYDIDIFMDDNGQCYYAYVLGHSMSAGTYNPIEACKEMIEYELNEYLDVKYRYTDKYAGAKLRFDSDNQDDKQLYLFYRGRKIAEVPMDLSLQEQILYGQRVLDTMAPALLK
jgi:hypothetical protein